MGVSANQEVTSRDADGTVLRVGDEVEVVEPGGNRELLAIRDAGKPVKITRIAPSYGDVQVEGTSCGYYSTRFRKVKPRVTTLYRVAAGPLTGLIVNDLVLLNDGEEVEVFEFARRGKVETPPRRVA